MKLVGSHWKDWEVWLEDSTGRMLNEYKVQYTPEGVTGTRVAKVHVECEDGQEFSICALSNLSPEFDWHMIPKVDGRGIEGLALSTQDTQRPHKIATFYDNVSGSICKRNLTFSKLNRVEDGPRLDSETASQLGTIELLLHGGTNERSETVSMPVCSASAYDTVDEKLKKVALSSYISGGAIVGRAAPRAGIRLHRDLKIPAYKIYATRPVLMLKDIIPDPRPNVAPPQLPRVTSAKKNKRKRHSAPGSYGIGEAGPSRIRVQSASTIGPADADEIEEVESPSKRRKIHTVDLTNDRKPPIFINLTNLDSDDDDDDDAIVITDEKPDIDDAL